MQLLRNFLRVFLILLLSLNSAQAEVVVAVAANFKVVLADIVKQYVVNGGDPVELVSGSTGSLYAQIENGAPFDIFFAADERRIDALIANGKGIEESRFTYAQGRLVLLIHPQSGIADINGLLASKNLTVAIANPRTAPYGKAALEVLGPDFSGRIAKLPNVAAAFAAFASGACDAALVAASSIEAHPTQSKGLATFIDRSRHAPLRQDAIVLRSVGDRQAALRFLKFIQLPEQQAAIRAAGYDGSGRG